MNYFILILACLSTKKKQMTCLLEQTDSAVVVELTCDQASLFFRGGKEQRFPCPSFLQTLLIQHAHDETKVNFVSWETFIH